MGSEPTVAARPDRSFLAAAVALLALTLLAFAPVLFGGATLLSFDERIVPPFVRDADPSMATRPQNFITSDLQGWILAHSESAAARLRHGELPLWDPTELCGRPLHADASFPTFYLPDFVYLLLPAVTAYAWSMALHVGFAAIGMLLLLRRLRLAALPAAVGALVFAFSGWMAVHLHIPHFVRTGAWLPWIVLASSALAEVPSARRAGLFALAVGAAALTAYPPIFGVLLFVALAAGLVFCLRSGRHRAALGWHAAGALAGLALGAVTLLPTRELRDASLRSKNLDESAAAAKSLRPEHLIALAAPEFQGSPPRVVAAGYPVVEHYPVARRFFATEVQDNCVENTLYGGIVGLLLAVVAIATKRNDARRAGFLLLFMAGIVIALHTPLQWLFRDWLVPGLGSGSPKRALLISSFGLAGLAALGAQRLLEAEWEARARRVLLTAALVLVALLASGWWSALAHLPEWGNGSSHEQLSAARRLVGESFGFPLAVAVIAALAGILALLVAGSARGAVRRVAVGLLLVTLAIELVAFAWRFNPAQPPSARGARTEVIDFLAQPENGGRTVRLERRELLPASIVSQWGVASVDGIQALLVREVAELLQAWQPGCIDPANPNQIQDFGDAARFGLPITRLLARFVVWNQPPPAELGLREVYRSEREGLALSEIPGALPAAFFADRALVAPERERRLSLVTSTRFDPARVAIVESDAAIAELAPAVRVADESTPPAAAPSTALVARRVDPETFTVHVENGADGVLVLNEAFFPGWIVDEVGDRGPSRAPIRVDHAFLGVPLRAGKHELIVHYSPRSFWFGAAISAAALLASLSLLVMRRGAPRPALATTARAPDGAA